MADEPPAPPAAVLGTDQAEVDALRAQVARVRTWADNLDRRSAGHGLPAMIARDLYILLDGPPQQP